MPVVGIIKNVPRVEIQQIQVTDWINKQLTTDAKLLEPFKTTVWDANGSVVSCANFSIHRQSFPSRSDKSDRNPSEICTDHEKYDNFLVEKIWHLDKGTWHTKYIWSPPTRQNHTPKKQSFFFSIPRAQLIAITKSMSMPTTTTSPQVRRNAFSACCVCFSQCVITVCVLAYPSKQL